MKILLTGASGFIGTYFRKKYSSKYSMSYFSFLNNNFEDLCLNEIEVVVHLSALVHQMGGASKEEYYNINLNQTISLAKKAKLSGVKHFIFMSTVKVYGDESNVKYTENSECLTNEYYGMSKLKAEENLQKLENDTFKISIIRTPIVYGYGVKANIKNLITLTSKIPFLPFGNIDNVRSMIYIGNLSYLITTIIDKQESGVFLASDDKSISTSQLIELIAKKLNKHIFLLNIPFFEDILRILKPDFHKRLYGSFEIDNSLTRKILNLNNPYTIEEGIEIMITGKENK